MTLHQPLTILNGNYVNVSTLKALAANEPRGSATLNKHVFGSSIGSFMQQNVNS